MTKLAIFDMDGTLFYTDHLNYASYKEALNYYGYDLSYEQYYQEISGRSYKDFLPKIVDSSLVEKVHDLKIKLYLENLSYAQINNHLFNIIGGLKSLYKIALVTTASQENTFALLKHFNRYDVFDLIITSNEVKNTKPDPEGFLKAMEYFNVSPAQTIIFEDSEIGLQAAQATKAQVYIVKFPSTMINQ